MNNRSLLVLLFTLCGFWACNNSTPGSQSDIRSSETPEAVPMSNTNSDLNQLSAEEKAAGWKLLFDGKSTQGWRNYLKQDIGSDWKVKDGTLMLEPNKEGESNGGDIITEEEFENFELSLEWKISPCGNSGIMFNVVENEKYPTVWRTGPEMQILDNTCHPDAKIEKHRAGDLYDLIASSEEPVKPAGEWNQVKIVLNNGHLEHWVNGKKVVETEMWTDDWNKMVANSKFKDMEAFGKAKKGHISLQDHSDAVWFRNIKIREL